MASGDSLLILRAGNGVPTATSSAGLTSISGASVPAERYTVLSFDDTTPENWDFPFVMPQSYAGGGTTLRFITSVFSGTGTYIMEAAWRRAGDDVEDLGTSHSYSFSSTSAISPPDVIDEVSYDDLIFTDGAAMDSVTAGDMCILRVRKNGGTITGDTYLHMIELRET